MKRIILTLGVMIAGLLTPAPVSQVSAQLEPSLTAKIPFSFTVCREHLAAGVYTIKHPPGNITLLTVKGEDNRSTDIACVSNIYGREAMKEGKLVFNRYGDQYFLAEAWWPGDATGHAIVMTDQEKALIKEYSEGEPKKAKKPEKVIIKFTKKSKSN